MLNMRVGLLFILCLSLISSQESASQEAPKDSIEVTDTKESTPTNETERELTPEEEQAEFEKFENDPANKEHILRAKTIACFMILKEKGQLHKQAVSDLVRLSQNQDPVNSLFLPDCFAKINILQAFDIVNERNQEKIDYNSPELTQFFPIEHWTQLYSSGDQTKIKEEIERIAKIIPAMEEAQEILAKDFEEESKIKEEERKKKQNEERENAKKRQEERKKESKSEEENEGKKRKPGEISILGFDIKELPSSVKNSLGFGFLFIIALGLYLGYQRISSQPEKKKKIKQKKN